MKNMKKSLRARYLSKRSSLANEEATQKNQKVCHHLNLFVKNSLYSTCFGYLAFRHEPNLEEFYLKLKNKLIFGLPVIKSEGRMEFRAYQPSEPLVKGPMGNLEPPKDSLHRVLSINQSTLIIVPAIAVDHSGVRLGYGGGFYDRFLLEAPGAVTIGVVFEDCFPAELPYEAHDQKLDFVITEAGLRTFNPDHG